jgi:acyl-homoserine-lactone acylase
MTTGGPDTADIYELKLDPSEPTRYRYDDAWREMTSRQVTLKVRGEPDQTHSLWFSHHGPVVARRGHRAYAARIAYAEVVSAIEAWYEMNVARDYTGVVKALETRALFPQNVMVADTSGHIYYQRTGRVPVRPDGWDWTRPVDGSTARTEWQGIHPASDHLQVLNPPQGYMQNCNIPPDAMMEGSPFSPEGTRPYLYGSSPREQGGGYTNQRGGRAVTLLGADDSVTVEEMLAYAVDVRPHGVGRWLALLGEALDGAPDAAIPTEVRRAAEELVGWDGELRHDSVPALRYAYWRQALAAELGEEAMRELSEAVDDWSAVLRGEEPPALEPTAAQREAVLRACATALETIEEHHGRRDATYGDRFRVGRGDRSWPVGGGGNSSLGLRTLRSMGYGPERPDHTRWGERGQTSTQVVELGDPVRSWIYLPVGQSDRPDSPHYTDQAERLFSPRRLKESWWLPEDLAGHVESRTELPFSLE